MISLGQFATPCSLPRALPGPHLPGEPPISETPSLPENTLPSSSLYVWPEHPKANTEASKNSHRFLPHRAKAFSLSSPPPTPLNPSLQHSFFVKLKLLQNKASKGVVSK